MRKWAAVTLVAVTIIACVPAHARTHFDWTTFTAEDAVGSWCGEVGEVFALSESGEFLLTHISAELYQNLTDRFYKGEKPALESLQPNSASGQWGIDEISGTWRLWISFRSFDEVPAGFSIELFAARRKDDDREALLYHPRTRADFEAYYEFVRCAWSRPDGTR